MSNEKLMSVKGGLDLCWGRWDLPHHPISDVHPTDIKETVFLGQDYNNARVMDFHTVDQWTQNKLKRTESSRMGK
jgi:phospholipase D1/2